MSGIVPFLKDPDLIRLDPGLLTSCWAGTVRAWSLKNLRVAINLVHLRIVGFPFSRSTIFSQRESEELEN